MTASLCKAVTIVTNKKANKRSIQFSDLGITPIAQYLWTWFWQIEGSRQGGMAIQAFTYQEIESWARLTNETPRPWEVLTLKSMDQARRDALNVKKEDEKPQLDGEAFDNIFG